MKRALSAVVLPVLVSSPFRAQSESQLRQLFEGKLVVLKIDMPGTSKGVNIDPGATPEMKVSDYSRSLVDNGIAVRNGDSIMVTRIRVKDDHIEFHLGGGGYSGYGLNVSDYVASVGKTEREKNLERDLKQTTDPERKRATKEEIDRLKRSREREDARNRVNARETAEREKENLRARRANGGSRFNIAFQKGTSPELLTPEWLMEALARYVEFPREGAGRGMIARPPAGADSVMSRIAMLRKGLTQPEVESLIGKPRTTTPGLEGKLQVTRCRFQPDESRVIEALFVEGVLVRFTIQSQ
jgi:hypothetical protein